MTGAKLPATAYELNEGETLVSSNNYLRLKVGLTIR